MVIPWFRWSIRLQRLAAAWAQCGFELPHGSCTPVAQHTEAILRELGRSDSHIAAPRAAGAFWLETL